MYDKLTFKQGLVGGEFPVEGRDNLLDGHLRGASGQTSRSRLIVGNHDVCKLWLFLDFVRSPRGS